MRDTIIIGKGPAGISAALYTVRSGIDTLIIGKDLGSVGRAESIENYYGFENPISGEDLGNAGIAQAMRLGAEVITQEVVSIGFEENFTVTTNTDEYETKSIIIATGSARAAPRIPGINEFEGKGISYCALCDGFFYRGQDVAVLGSSEFAIHEAKELLPIVNSVTLLTNAVSLQGDVGENIAVNTKSISEIYGTDRVEGVRFTDMSSLPVSGVFIAYGTADSTALARKLGIDVENNKIVVDNTMATNIPGIFAAGDCTGGVAQVNRAVYQGAVAGTSVSRFIRSINNNS